MNWMPCGVSHPINTYIPCHVPQLYSTLKAAEAAVLEHGLELKSVDSVDVHRLQIASANLWTADSIRRFDARWAEEVGGHQAARMWNGVCKV